MVNVCAISTVLKPVTQTALVEMKSASATGSLICSNVERGSNSSSVPKAMTVIKQTTIKSAGFVLLFTKFTIHCDIVINDNRPMTLMIKYLWVRKDHKRVRI